MRLVSGNPITAEGLKDSFLRILNGCQEILKKTATQKVYLPVSYAV